MELARRAAATSGIDDGYRVPNPSTSHGRMAVDALRLELLKESIRQELIMAELAERRELGSDDRRDRGLENAGLRLTPLPQHDTFPGGARMLKRHIAKERIEEWYQPLWRDRSWDKDNASLIRVTWSKKALSGVKRKRTPESSAPNKQRSYEQWMCTLCHMNTFSELSFKEHCAGQQHMSNVVDLEWTEGTVGLKKITAKAYQGMQQSPWNCNICKVKCSGELDLKNHLKGRRHQENVEALWGESKEIKGNGGFHEAGSYEKKVPEIADKSKIHVSRWNCSICKASCTSMSDLDSHLRGRGHQKNVEAQLAEENNTILASLAGGK